MDILKVDKCDFMVFSLVDKKTKFIKVDVGYDESFWREKRERLRIHREWFVPEQFMYRTIFHRVPLHLVYSPYNEEHNDSYFGDLDELRACLHVQSETEFVLDDEMDQSL